MSTLTIRLPDDKHERLKALARSSAISENKLMDELATVALANFDRLKGGNRSIRGSGGTDGVPLRASGRPASATRQACKTKAKYVPGLTATPIRRDGQQPIIFMQCGPIRYTAAKPASAPHDLEAIPRSRLSQIEVPTDAGIQDDFRHLANDTSRTDVIAMEVKRAYEMGRKVLVLVLIRRSALHATGKCPLECSTGMDFLVG